MRERPFPRTANECANFHFLVKECGISPLDIPYLTPLQEKILILQQNRIIEEQEREMKKVNKGNKPARRAIRKGHRRG